MSPFASDQRYPRLRPVEVFPSEKDGQQIIVVQDPSGLATGPLVISAAGLLILSLLDGEHGEAEIREAFAAQFGQELDASQLADMVEQLDAAHYLDSDNFAAFYGLLVDEYRSSPVRVSGDAASFGADGDDLDAMLGRMLRQCDVSRVGAKDRRLVGLVAPHLDYMRGGPGYANAYAALVDAGPIERFVILGTNHCGRATSVVATGKDFRTPLGTTTTDRDFLLGVEERCGWDLCEHEFDHLREHSIELQVLILQHLFGAENFQIVPFLCHDPCGPTGTAPYDGHGVDLRVFGETLGALIREDRTPTIVLTGADLSHIGWRFGDENDLDEVFLAEVERQDRELLTSVVAGEPSAFVQALVDRKNSTRVCSAGCLYALMAALPYAQAELLSYHQAVDRSGGTGVTCSALALWQSCEHG